MSKSSSPSPDRLRSLAGVCFDLDNTLYSRDEAAFRLYRSWLDEEGRPLLDEIVTRDRGGYSPREEFFQWFESQIGESDLWARFQDELASFATLPDDSRALLSYLRDHSIPRAILSNGGKAQRRKFAALGLEDYFCSSDLFVSSEIGFSKPDRQAFLTVSSHLHLPPAALLHIGDHPQLDIRGARRAGLRTCWLTAEKAPSCEDADLTISSLHPLIKHLPFRPRRES